MDATNGVSISSMVPLKTTPDRDGDQKQGRSHATRRVARWLPTRTWMAAAPGFGVWSGFGAGGGAAFASGGAGAFGGAGALGGAGFGGSGAATRTGGLSCGDRST